MDRGRPTRLSSNSGCGEEGVVSSQVCVGQSKNFLAG